MHIQQQQKQKERETQQKRPRPSAKMSTFKLLGFGFDLLPSLLLSFTSSKRQKQEPEESRCSRSWYSSFFFSSSPVL